MTSSLLAWLQRPYPQIEELRVKLAISLLVGLVCFLFLLIHQPFGLSTIHEVELYLLGFGCNGAIGMLLGYFFLPKLRPQSYRDEHYTVMDEVIFFVFVLSSISIINVIYNSTIGRDFSPQYGLFAFAGMTLSVGVIPIFIVVFLTEKFSRTSNIKAASSVNAKLPTTNPPIETSTKNITFQGGLKSDALIQTTQQNWLYVKADINYVEAYHVNATNEIKRTILRASLKDIEHQLNAQQARYLRCHKSYLINPSRIERVEGNARSLYVKLHQLPKLIPVSRSFDRSLLVSSAGI